MTLQQHVPSTEVQNYALDKEIETGLDFIINHFDPTVLYFPRTIMTKKLEYQKEVFSKEEALQYFNQSDFTDCRINSYRYSSSYNTRYQCSPDFIFIDLDKNDFKTERSFELALSITLKNIKEKLNGYPTILFTGGGYHIYQPIDCSFILLEKDFNIFNEFDESF